jgi:cyclophilin family peptidyl-prolyl cis-trans isomerase
MKKLFTFFLISTIAVTAFAKPKNQYVRIKTAYGFCIVRLYNETPKHRDNFIKLTKEGFFNGSLFHRVIQDFMIQGGGPAPGSDTAKYKKTMNYKIPAEIRDSIFHKRGVLAAARDDNPEKASSSSQFYLVAGKRFTDSTLNKTIKERLKGRKIPESERAYYKSVGGVPHLDQGYTVFGEIITGQDMVDEIAAVKKDKKDKPLVNIPMTVELLSPKECRRLDKILGPLTP